MAEVSEDEFIESIFSELPPFEPGSPESELPGESSVGEEEKLTGPDGNEIRLCEECGVNPLARKNGKGRWPKYCTECRKPRTGGTPKRTKADPNPRLSHLASGLAHNIALVGIGSAYVAPTFGYLVCQGSDAAGKAIVELAKDRPAVLAALETAAKVGPGIELTKWIFTCLLALAIDFGRIPPDQVLAQFLGVTDAYEKTHDHRGNPVGNMNPLHDTKPDTGNGAMPDIPLFS
jgi:hypothetical protein